MKKIFGILFFYMGIISILTLILALNFKGLFDDGTTSHPSIGSSLITFEHTYGENHASPIYKSNESIGNEHYYVRLNESKKVIALGLHDFPDHIHDITNAMIYTQDFLPSDSRLRFSSQTDSCDTITSQCQSTYFLTYESTQYRKLTDGNERFVAEIVFTYQYDLHSTPVFSSLSVYPKP